MKSIWICEGYLQSPHIALGNFHMTHEDVLNMILQCVYADCNMAIAAKHLYRRVLCVIFSGPLSHCHFHGFISGSLHDGRKF